MKSKQLVLMAMLVAIAVAGSAFVYLPTGIARAYPVQHAINVMAAVFFGPVPAVIIAFLTGAVRVLTGTGSLLAFPGGMIGAFLAGILYIHSGRLWLAAAGEIIGTGIIASVVAVPYARILMGTEAAFFFFMPAFLVSSISGSLLGVLLMYKLRKTKTNNVLY
ncbi:energy coupling factor transporter S component ThiW [Psychrobacillus psychrodurans]|uniref:Energy coupling factor transporter S component ThiW n=1 Tax=Psychrobacillus psychrodurans TaxID=126157 RepID=A0A9X3R9P7_9BACI|nr:energy coupling factor transporter S component ThiW [Psychrobacillus psychrodurans]MCZ8533700.1 energy coupling factor transporter S component ThiW [Psychrobacillus psychrodurans]